MFSHLFEKNTPLLRDRNTKKRIIAVALDLPVTTLEGGQYAAKSVKEKIDLLAETVEEICENLKPIEKDSLWVLVWREYGVTGYMGAEGEEEVRAALSAEEKRYFLTTFQDLAQRYAPNLVIAAGTVLTYKSGQDRKKVEKISGYYEKGKDFLALEEYEREENQVKKFISEKKETATVLKNVAYLFYGKKTVSIAKKKSL